jgi:fermentation-respiration switch protein FrsA (DUF1100 family)
MTDVPEVKPICPPTTRRRWRKRLRLLALLPVLVYVAYAAALYHLQDAIVFPGQYRPRVDSPGPGDATIEQVWLTRPDGVRIEAWYQPGEGCTASSPGPALLYFHGNYDVVDTGWWIAAHAVPRGVTTLVMEYRGYGRTGGQPSEAALVADGVALHDWLAARPEVDPARIVLQGLSLGGGVATAVAAQRPPAALVLECTFTSIPDLAWRRGLPGWLCRSRFETDRLLPTLSTPIAIFHGRYDETIPVACGRRLHELAPGSEYHELNCGHANFHHPFEDVLEFLAKRGILQAEAGTALTPEARRS